MSRDGIFWCFMGYCHVSLLESDYYVSDDGLMSLAEQIMLFGITSRKNI